MAEQAWRPRPCGYAHRRSGSPWVPVRPYYEGLPSMAGRGPDEGSAKAGLDRRGVQLPCPDPEDGPGVEDAISGAPGGGVPARHEGAFYEVPDQDVAPIGAPLPHVREGQGKGRRPEARSRASSTRYGASPKTGAMNHVCFAGELHV